ncbi:hypothetical protein RhiirC2_790728 [Rhizophagus irregularis]|uniref:Uncharacterized protein n=1 Tax=Rhizophagus irregularis TaxID=588596 RepID=A0A2N1MKL9_9GLOM|nr:hypothetical protein RhiirC2_790728 [Rhizophagus irregularis]
MQFKINSLREINLKLLVKIIELKKENAEVKIENVKLKHALLEEHEARFTSLKQRDEEKATRLDDDIKEIKQSSASTSSVENSDICQPIRTEIKTLEEKEMDAFLNKMHKKSNEQDASACEDLIKEISTKKLDILQNIVNLYEKVCNAEDVSIKANQTEILCWSNFIIAFDKSIDEIMVIDRVSQRTNL